MNNLKNHVVSILYTLKDDQGTILDSSSESSGPLVYIHGLGQIIPGLEEAIAEKSKGDKFQVSIPPEKAYGPRNEELVFQVPKTEFPDVTSFSKGMQFEMESDHGPMVLTVLEVLDSEVVLDGNHFLAGMRLNFQVEIVDLRMATPEELSHGHVHGPGGHHH